MVIKRRMNRNQIAEVKLQILEIISKDPKISYEELSRRLGINNKTAKKYKVELETMRGRLTEEITKNIEQKVEEKVSIWQKMLKTLGL